MIRFFILLMLTIFSFNTLRAEPDLKISEFLHSSKKNYNKIIQKPKNTQKIHFVMGNESGDLDSIISSISYAYLLSQQEGATENEIYLPLLNFYREEIDLRKDIFFLFQLLQVSTDDLLFIDDNVPLDELLQQDRLRFNLVDHNALRPRQEHLSNAVERIVDHHADENKNYPLLTEGNKTIAVVGSAATLVTEKILSQEHITIAPELAMMLLAPILIDTTNLQSQDKTTERDIQAAEALQSIALEIMPEGFYEELLKAKNDITGLTPAMLLSKDFKEYLDGELLYGISSLPSSVSWGPENLSEIVPVIEKYAQDRGLAYLIILMTNPDPKGPKRQLIVFSPSENLLMAFDAYVKADEALANLLMPGPESENSKLNFYMAEKLVARKQLQPLFHFSENPEIKSIFEQELNH